MSDTDHVVQDSPALAGSSVELDSDDTRREVLEKAFDFRGDVTLSLRDGGSVEGYLFDRRERGGAWEARVLTPAGERRSVPYAEVTRLAFSTRDPAAGKSWETWLKKYVEKKLTGETASMEPDKLD